MMLNIPSSFQEAIHSSNQLHTVYKIQHITLHTLQTHTNKQDSYLQSVKQSNLLIHLFIFMKLSEKPLTKSKGLN